MKRSKGKLIERILEICIEPSGKTRIIYRANLNFDNATRYISVLMKSGLLEAAETTPILYKITPKGWDFMERISPINAQIGNNVH